MKFDVRINELLRVVEIERDTQGSRAAHIEGNAVEIDVVEIGQGFYSIRLDGAVFDAYVLGSILPGDALSVRCRGAEFRVDVCDPRAWRGARAEFEAAQGRQHVAAPMPSKVVRVLVAAGDIVEAGRGLVVLEAMKMQNEIRAPRSGSVERVFVVEGQNVSAGETLVIIA